MAINERVQPADGREPTPPRTHAKPRRRGRGPLIALGVLAALALVAGGGYLVMTRPQGEPQAVELADATLSATLTGAKVLALGEATHGNAEFQQMRTTLAQKAAASGFRTIVLEEDFGATTEVNAYVQGGPGTAQEAAKKFGFAINKTQQTAEWLQWLHDHNAKLPADQRIQLVGMDVQRVSPALRIVAASLSSANPQAAAKATAAATAGQISREDLAALKTAVEALPASPERKNAEVAVQALSDNLSLKEQGNQYAAIREKAMFTNLKRIVSETQGGVLVYGQNGHVAKVGAGAIPDPVGAQAAREWGDTYRVIGTDFRSTRFLSGNAEQRKEWSLTNRSPLHGIYAKTRIGYQEIATASPANRALFDSTQPMGSAGEGFTWLQWAVLPLHTVFVVPSQLYDAVVVVDDATPVTML